MKIQHAVTTTFAAIALAAILPPVWAHGDAAHDKKPAARKISTEEHPFGREGDPIKATRTITVGMADTMRFKPGEITVRAGETVKFIAKNGGKVMHEMVIGTEEELKKHAALMQKNPGMEHDEPYMAHVKPGATEEIVWTFTKPGTYMYGCLIPGHFEAGMKGAINVVAQASVAAATMTEGEVRKIDKEQGKITLKHGEIKNLDMPSMTMVFRVKDAAMLDQVKEGDKIMFTAEKPGGQFTVTGIEKK